MIFINVSIKKLNMNYRKICTFITRDMEHGIFACYQKCLAKAFKKNTQVYLQQYILSMIMVEKQNEHAFHNKEILCTKINR